MQTNLLHATHLVHGTVDMHKKITFRFIASKNDPSQNLVQEKGQSKNK